MTLEVKDVNVLNERISREGAEKCMERQKNGKAVGLSDIPYEFYKNAGVAVSDWMTNLFN